MRICRLLVGMTQKALATELEFTAQLVQMYESGSSPISASVLKEIAGIFGMPISYFFEERARSDRLDDAHLEQAETLKLVRFYYTMPVRVRRRYLKMVKAVAAASISRQPVDDIREGLCRQGKAGTLSVDSGNGPGSKRPAGR